MRLLYLYASQYECFKNQEFNFTSIRRFHYEYDDKRLFDERIDSKFPVKYFNYIDFCNPGQSIDGPMPISEITCVVGKNGCGKTTLSRLICELLHNRKINFKYIMVKEENDKIFCCHNISNLDLNVEEKDKIIEYRREDNCNSEIEDMEDNNSVFLYYSPVLTTEYVKFPQLNCDLSTTYFFEHYSLERNYDYASVYSHYISYENQNILRFLKANNSSLIKSKFSRILEGNHVRIILNIDGIKELQQVEKGKRKNSLDVSDDNRICRPLYHTECLFNETLKFEYNNKSLLINIFQLYIASWLIQHWTGKLWVDSGTFQDDKSLEGEDPEKYFHKFEGIIKKINGNGIKENEIIEIIEKYGSYKTKKFFEEITKINKKHNILDIDESLAVVDLYYKLSLNHDIIFFEFEPKKSSGEKALLSMFSRIYKAIKDNYETGNKFIILFLDEVETTMHPEWQKECIYGIIEFIHTFFSELSFHIIFSSHSPLLLSDIPLNHVIYLDEHKNVTRQYNNCRTFAANMYSLYINSFFMRNGVMGKYAYNILKGIFTSLKSNDNNLNKGEMEDYLSILKNVGDVLIREQLDEKIKSKKQ